MAIIEERIRALALSERDCLLLNEPELNALLVRLKPILAGTTSEADVVSFSIVDCDAEIVTNKLNSLGIQDQEVLACWPTFRAACRIKWDVLTKRLDDLWYPSSDDLIVTSLTSSWFMEISHEEFVRFVPAVRSDSRQGNLPWRSPNPPIE